MKKRARIKQKDITDCGAACIASIATYYRLRLPISRIRQIANTDKKGTNVLGLIEAGEKLGFQIKAAKGPFESLFKIPLPAIAHMVLVNQLQHYVVIFKVTKRHIIFMDPADGRVHKKPHDEFEKIWSGVIILMLPDDGFETGDERISVRKRFWQLMRPHSSMMVQALIGAVVSTILGLSISIYIQKVVDFVLIEGNKQLLNLLSMIMVVIFLFQWIINHYQSVIALRTGQAIDAKLILGYYKHLMKLPQRFFDTMRVGEITSRLSDAVKIRMFVNEVIIGLSVNILTILLAFAIMFIYYWKLALILLGIVPIYILLYFISNQINKKWQRRLMENAADLETQLVESINMAGTIKRFGIENVANEKTENRFSTLLKSIYTTGIYSIRLGNTSDFFTKFFTVVIIWSGSYFVINRQLSPGELLSFYALIAYFTSPAMSLISANKSIQDASIAADRLFEIIDLEAESAKDSKVDLTPDMIGKIEFKNVTFRHGSRVTVFEGLNLSISPKEVTAVVGESGSGKSTLLSLLQNLYPLKEGSISIGGIDLKHIENRSLRKIIGVIPQQIDLFADTIIGNIALGDLEPDMHKILRLSRMLGINEFIEVLPNTYNTLLSENGANLSGGQRQRLAIARALYRDPEILILDEATSSLDPASAQKVQETLTWFLRQNKTIITIAHRLSTVKNLDRIIVLDKGKVVEEGTHNELIAAEGLYSRLIQVNTV